MSATEDTSRSAAVAPAVVAGVARQRAVVGVLSLSGVVVALQQTLVVPILPDFAVALDVPSTTASWLVTATLLTGAVATPLVGRMADMYGKRAMMLLCLTVMTVGAVISALSSSFEGVVVGRVFQGFAVALLPVGISLMRDVLPPDRLGVGVALMSGALGIGGMFGMPMAGVIHASLSWHWLFWVTAAVGVVMLVLLLWVVPESPVKSGGRFDQVGALLLSVSLTGLLLAVSKGGEWGWTSPTILGLVGIGLLTLAMWVPYELRVPQPLVDLRTTTLRPVLVSNICAVLLGFAMFLSAYTATQHLQAPVESGFGHGLSEAASGLAMLPGGVAMLVLVPLSARMTARWGARTTLFAGAVVIAAGYLLRVLAESTVTVITVSAAVISGGVALTMAAMPVLITEAAPRDQTASANSVNGLMRSVGTSSASAVGAAVLASSTLTVAGVTVPTLSAFHTMYLIGAGTSIAAAVIAVAVPMRSRA
ncbi:MFS transporter [Rhodococcus kronopolitis]|uniref:MFS transporter n=1 Tax=Rhodococcus kronopolitis TaxID=1460226 RepID=A0ABV9FT43_9NOCA